MTTKRKLATVRRTGRRTQLILTIPLPSLRWLGEIRSHAVDYILSLGLVVIGGAGIASVILPAISPPPSTPVALAVTPSPTTNPKPVGLARSIPTRLEVPDIGLATDLVQLGKNADGSLETPSDYVHAGWYVYSPTPGEVGPAIITGHVDSYQGPAVFFYLKDLQPKQLIYVYREDKTVVKFQVDSVALFDQAAFPTDKVYGNLDYPGLRLITCGGVYNAITGHYSHNTVVYASYVSR